MTVDLKSKSRKTPGTGRVAQVGEHLSSKLEALSSNSSTEKNKNKNKKNRHQIKALHVIPIVRNSFPEA
jgi:primosomal protein N''